MAASGRPLTERAARDWWSKGLLPGPRRRGLGQGRGTETYWIDPRVPAQAEAAYDCLALHAPTYLVAVHLWLSGFPIELALIRGAYRRILHHYLGTIQVKNGSGEKISVFAAQISGRLVKDGKVPRAIRDDLTDLALPFLEVFFSVGGVFEEDGLSDLWATVEPYLWDIKRAGTLNLNDHQLGVAASYLSRMGSLTAQHDAICTASDYELIRARRLLLLIRGYIQRLVDLSGSSDALETHCPHFSIAMSRPTIPIIVIILREARLRSRIIESLFHILAKLRPQFRSEESPC